MNKIKNLSDVRSSQELWVLLVTVFKNMAFELEEGNPFLVLQGPDNFFNRVEYWDQRYVRRLANDEELSEWYSVDINLLQTHKPIQDLIEKAKLNQWHVLDIGCGNSSFFKLYPALTRSDWN